MQYNYNKQQIRDAMKRHLPVIHDGVQYDEIVEHTIRHGAGYAYVILRKGEKLAFAGAGDITIVEPDNSIQSPAETERSTNESNT